MSKIFGVIVLLVLFNRFLNSTLGSLFLTIVGGYLFFKFFGPTIISLVKKLIEKIKYR